MLTRLVAASQSFSPELIVHPYLRDGEELAAPGERADALDRGVEDVCAWLPRLDALVVGPGLGRDEAVLAAAERVVRASAAAQRTRLLMPLRRCAPRWSARCRWCLTATGCTSCSAARRCCRTPAAPPRAWC